MIFAKKSLGQNFLKSEKTLREIVDAGDVRSGDIILEIGPGEGALTKRILEKNPQKLIVVEKDDRLIPILEAEFSADKKNFQIIHGDILELLTEDGEKNILQSQLVAPYKVIANIPYYITGIVIRKIFGLGTLPERVVLLLQKEVADRIVAVDKKESLLSLSIKLYGTPKRIAIVPRGAFAPAPNVDSAIISIENIGRKLPKADEEDFFRVIKAAFAHKRKRLAKNLEGTGGLSSVDWETALLKLGLSKNARAEDLSAENYIHLAGILKGRS